MVTRIVTTFAESVEANPDGIAVVDRGAPVTFRALERLSDRYASGLADLDVTRGTRVAFMVTPGPEFLALCFAFFRIGAVPVLIDAGMDMRNLRQCLEEAEPEVFIGIPRAHEARVQLGWGERTVRLNVTVGEPGSWGGPSVDDFPETDRRPAAADVEPDDEAMILFTTGSTGPPKGAVFTYSMCDAQLTELGRVFDMRMGRTDMPTLPTFAPYAVAHGMTSVIADMDFMRPAEVDAADLLAQIEEHGVASMFGSPALLDRLGRHGEKTGATIPTMRRVVTASAPITPQILARFAGMLEPGAEIAVLYGATESMPISFISADDILGETAAEWARGAGTCVGAPVDALETAIIPISDDPLPAWDADLPLPSGEIGELAVKGPVVSREYRGQPAANVAAKVYDPADGRVWHRTGDAMRVDDAGRLWFQGRVKHRVVTGRRTMHTVSTEAIFNQHPRIKRTALVGVGPAGSQRAVLCAEVEEGEPSGGSPELRAELLELARSHDHTAEVEEVLFHPRFPVDIRHNSKIFREKLAVWAAEQLSLQAASANGGGGDRPAPDGEYVELARRGFEAFGRHDASFLELLDPDIESDVPGGLPGGGELHGQLALVEFLDTMTEHFEDPMVHPEKYVDGGDEVVVFGRWSARGRRTGREVDLPITMRWGFKNGLAVRYQSYIDTAPIQEVM